MRLNWTKDSKKWVYDEKKNIKKTILAAKLIVKPIAAENDVLIIFYDIIFSFFFRLRLPLCTMQFKCLLKHWRIWIEVRKLKRRVLIAEVEKLGSMAIRLSITWKWYEKCVWQKRNGYHSMEISGYFCIQILREINFGESRSLKIAAFAVSGALNFIHWLNSILQNFFKVKIQSF